MEVREEIVKACLAEMRAQLASATPETRAHADATILFYSGLLKTFKAEQIIPSLAA